MADDNKATEALALVRDVKSDFRERNDLYKFTEDVVFKRTDLQVPEEFKDSTREFRSPLPLHTINTTSAALSVNDQVIQFDPITIGETGIANASLRTNFFEASWRRQEEEAHRRILRMLVWNAVAKGECVVKTTERSKRAWGPYYAYSKKTAAELDGRMGTEEGYDQSRRDRDYDRLTEEKKRGMPYPIASIDVPPEDFYYIRGEDGFSCCIEEKRVPYYDTLVRYKMGITTGGKIVPEAMGLPEGQWRTTMDAAESNSANRRTLAMYEVWTWDECRYILCGPGDNVERGEGQVVKKWKHGYGIKATRTLRGPYFQSFGITTALRTIHLMGLSVLYPFLELYGELDTLMTMQNQAAFRFAYPAYKRRQQPGLGMPDNLAYLSPAPGGSTTPGQLAEFKVRPGRLVPWDIEPVELGHAGIDLDKMLALVRQLIDLALPAVVQGLVTGDESGYMLNQASHLARLMWDPIIDNLQFMLAQRVGFESWLIEHKIHEGVYVWGDQPAKGGYGRTQRGLLRVRPEDLGGVHRYQVKLDPSTPSNDIIKLRALAQGLQLRVITPRHAVEEMGGNYDEVKEEWLVFDIEQDPRVREDRVNRVLTKLDIRDEDQIRQAMGGLPAPGMEDQLGDMAPTPTAGDGLPIAPPMPANAGQAAEFIRTNGAVPGEPVQPNPRGGMPL